MPNIIIHPARAICKCCKHGPLRAGNDERSAVLP